MQDEISYNKNSLDEALKKLGKEIRRLGGKEIRAEITIVGGAAIIAGNTFRESTTDIDAIFRALSLIKRNQIIRAGLMSPPFCMLAKVLRYHSPVTALILASSRSILHISGPF